MYSCLQTLCKTERYCVNNHKIFLWQCTQEYEWGRYKQNERKSLNTSNLKCWTRSRAEMRRSFNSKKARHQKASNDSDCKPQSSRLSVHITCSIDAQIKQKLSAKNRPQKSFSFPLTKHTDASQHLKKLSYCKRLI